MTGRRLRLAWVSPYLPEPATTGGSIRQQELARALSASADVHLFARGELWEIPRLASDELSLFSSKWLGRDYLPAGPFRSNCPSRRVRNGSPRALYAALLSAHRQRAFDAVVVAHSWAAHGAAELGVPWLLDAHNIEARYFADLARSRGIEGRANSEELLFLETFERRAWTDAGAVTCVSEGDAREIAGVRGSPVHVVGNGCHFPREVPATDDARREGLLFVGSLTHAPNVDAVARAISFMPQLWVRFPRLTLTVVGGPVPRELDRAVAALPQDHRAQVTLAGVVPHVAPFLARARAFVVPMRFGAGSSLKIAEAAAHGVPIVGTELGVRGFEFLPNRDYLQAETDEAFCEAISSALSGSAAIARIASEARERVRHLSWSAVGERFVALVRQVASDGPVGAGR